MARTWQLQLSQLTTNSPSRITTAKVDGSFGTTPSSLVIIKRLNSIEMAVRWAQRLCYSCDEKFVPRHHYKKKSLFLLIYEFLVMPFELMNTSSTFQSLMNEVFSPFFSKYLSWYFLMISLSIAKLERIIFTTTVSRWIFFGLILYLSRCPNTTLEGRKWSIWPTFCPVRELPTTLTRFK